MKYKLLVISSIENGLGGGCGVHQIVIEFDTEKEKDKAKNILFNRNSDHEPNITCIDLSKDYEEY